MAAILTKWRLPNGPEGHTYFHKYCYTPNNITATFRPIGGVEGPYIYNIKYDLQLPYVLLMYLHWCRKDLYGDKNGKMKKLSKHMGKGNKQKEEMKAY